MAGRGRKSLNARAVPVLPGRWPEPPNDLAEPEAAIWIAVTTSLPPDWFSPPNFPVLKQFCRHSHSCDLLAADISLWRAELAQAADRLSEARAKVPPDPKAIGREMRLRLQLQKTVRQLS